MHDIRTIQVTRYVTPLREGGSLPAIAEGDDGFLYVLKFRGAGQGPNALIADLLGGEIFRATGLKVPEIVFAQLNESFGRTEPDPEIQDLLRASEGLNLAFHYLSGAISYDPAVNKVSPEMAARILWLDAFLMNVDRTAKNTNMLTWRGDLWIIDFGASLYFHHSWDDWEKFSRSPFSHSKDHVLWKAGRPGIKKASEEIRSLLTPEKIDAIVSLIPGEWIHSHRSGLDAEGVRNVYREFLVNRMQHADIFVNEILHANA